MALQYDELIDDLLPPLVALRRDLHAHPELAFEERRTAGVVAAALRLLGLDVSEGLAGTGLVGVLRNGTVEARPSACAPTWTACPCEETNDMPQPVDGAGQMHACGHDGHTTMLLGAARYLADTRNFDGTVHFIFQPAEEGGGGGRVMVEEGLFDRFPTDQVYALHNDPELPLGEARITPGPVLAAADRITITVHGRAAMPRSRTARPMCCSRRASSWRSSTPSSRAASTRPNRQCCPSRA